MIIVKGFQGSFDISLMSITQFPRRCYQIFATLSRCQLETTLFDLIVLCLSIDFLGVTALHKPSQFLSQQVSSLCAASRHLCPNISNSVGAFLGFVYFYIFSRKYLIEIHSLHQTISKMIPIGISFFPPSRIPLGYFMNCTRSCYWVRLY